MQTIDIRLIRPSPNPIRKTWDEDKMQELAASIKERGVIVPIKVRPAGDEYEVVYGHRRVEASRRAGREEMPAIVEDMPDEDAYTQQLAENESREDVTLEDRARGYRYGMEMFQWSVSEIARRTGVPRPDVDKAILWLSEFEKGGAVSRSSNHPEGWTGVDHTMQIRYALGDDVRAKQLVAEKVSQEELTAKETRAVADAYKAAPTPELKEAVLNTSGKLGDADRILQVAQMNIGAAGLVDRHENERRQSFEEYDQAAKDFFDFMKLSKQMVKTAQGAARYGKFSPEGAQFAIGRINALIDELQTLKETLSHVE